jgi:glycoprotein endo-alpha-1,2-mannosidase
MSHQWRHWQGVDPASKCIDNSTDFRTYGAYDSHDPAIVERQVQVARAAGITGFVASWWGSDSFEDRGMSLLLSVAGRHELSVSAYYEKISGEDTTSRVKSAVRESTIC